VAQLLELAQLVDKHRVTQVQVRRGRIEAGLDAQRLAALELLNQLDSTNSSSAPRLISASCSSTDFITDPQGSDSKGTNHTRSASITSFARRTDPICRQGVCRLASEMIWLYFIQLFHLHHVIHLFQFIFFKVKITYDHRTV
jgi:hypothetical protein